MIDLMEALKASVAAAKKSPDDELAAKKPARARKARAKAS